MEIRKAVRKDVPLIMAFIRGIAEYEKMGADVHATEEMLAEWLFDKGIAETVFAVEDGKEVGFALYFHNFSTSVGKGGLYREGLFVLPSIEARAMARHCSCTLATRHASATAVVWNGFVSTGTSRA